MGALLFAILAGFNNIDVEKKHGEFFWQTHQEDVSQARTKDEKLSPVDGFSREFPIMSSSIHYFVQSKYREMPNG